MKKLLILFFLILGLSMQVYAADEWAKIQPAGTASPSNIDDLILVNNEAVDRLVTNYVEDCLIVYASSSTITVRSGEVTCSNTAGTLRRLRSNTSNTTVTWADIDTGAEANSTTYYIYAVADADATTFTCLISTSSSSPTGGTYYKKLGSFVNDSSGNIEQYTIVSDNVYVDWQGIVSNLRVYDSGWFAVSTTTAYTKTHGLGTTNILLQVWFSTASDGTAAQRVGELGHSSAATLTYGCIATDLSTTAITICTGATSVSDSDGWTWGGTTEGTDTSGYYRVVALALE